MDYLYLSSESTALYDAQLNKAPLGVFDPHLNSYKRIPAGLSPLIIDTTVWQKLIADAQYFLGVIEKTVRWLQNRDQKTLWDRLYKELTPLEQQAALGGFGSVLKLATLRLDLFFDRDDIKILEINATIPAMQAYSDIIKEAYLKAIIPAHQQKNSVSASKATIPLHLDPPNTHELLRSLLAHYRGTGGVKTRLNIAILARAGDSQLAELLWYIKEWTKLGHQVFLASPDQLSILKDRVYFGTTECDLIYRHIFAHKIAQHNDIVTMLSNYQRFKIFNPIAAHLEAKALMSIISECTCNPVMAQGIGIDETEMKILRCRLPWSRILNTKKTILPDGTQHECLSGWVRENPEKLVLKRSAGYGGHNVVIGSELDKGSNNLSREGSAWGELVDRIIKQKDETWLVQERIPGKKMHLSWLTENGIKEGEVFLDCSLFACTQNKLILSGGVSRFAEDPIVNIGKGGGLLPFFLSHEIDKIA